MNKKKIITIIIGIVIIIYILLSLLFSHIKEQQEQQQKQNITKQYQQIVKQEETQPTIQQEENNRIKQYQKEFNNQDIIGELSIENTNLKVPIAQSTDNNYYLNHLLDKTKNSLGSVYLDYRTKPTDRKIIIYGHNSENVYTEFNILENYLDKSYYQKHSKIYFQTEQGQNIYQIFSVYIATKDLQHVNINYNETQYKEHLQWLKNESLYNTGIDVYNENIMILQTCYYTPEDSYLIIAAKKVIFK